MNIADRRPGAVKALPENWAMLPEPNVRNWVWIIDLDAEPGKEKWGVANISADEPQTLILI